MIPMALAAFLLLALPQQSDPSSVPTPELTREQRIEQAKAKLEPMRQAAIRLNEMASTIHTEADARAFVDAVAEALNGNQRLPWTTRGMRRRVAHAEFEAVADASRLIPEQRIVEVWNEFAREINAPAESLVTLAEIHNLRDAMVVADQRLWDRTGFKSIWMAPGIHPIDADGTMASGCRAVEALKIFHTLYYQPEVLAGARQRVQQGILISDRVKIRGTEATPPPNTVSYLRAGKPYSNPALSAAIQYTRNHGAGDFDRLLMRLFEEFFPTE